MEKREEQFKIASILYDLGLSKELICVMTSLSQEELKKLYQS